MRSASMRQATSAAKVSLSPKRICSTDTVSFSFTTGTTDSSNSRVERIPRVQVGRAVLVSRRVSSTTLVSMSRAPKASA